MQEIGTKSKAAQIKMMENDPPPEMPNMLMFYVNAFYRLSTERQYAQGSISAIPFSKIMDYAMWLDYDADRFCKIIQAIDYEYISYHQERIESQRKINEMNAKRKT